MIFTDSGRSREKKEYRECKGPGKKARDTGDTIALLRERMVVETELRKREIKLKERGSAERNRGKRIKRAKGRLKEWRE